MLVGDAAGHVDPLTGEGIHTAMIAGKIAAEVCHEMFATGNFSLHAGEAYSLRCYDAFGYEFWSSSLCARIIHSMPIAIDAVAVVGARRGQAFLDFFGECMTGVRPKSDFAEPLLLLEIGLELVRQIVLQYIVRIEPLVPQVTPPSVTIIHRSPYHSTKTDIGNHVLTCYMLTLHITYIYHPLK